MRPDVDWNRFFPPVHLSGDGICGSAADEPWFSAEPPAHRERPGAPASRWPGGYDRRPGSLAVPGRDEPPRSAELTVVVA
jgi:hypothetical protein